MLELQHILLFQVIKKSEIVSESAGTLANNYEKVEAESGSLIFVAHKTALRHMHISYWTVAVLQLNMHSSNSDYQLM